MMHLLWTLIIGAIFGALARLFMKGDQGLSVLWTIILGALGGVAGGWLAKDVFGWDGNFAYILFGVLMSILFISIFLMVTRGSKRV